jgi:hypothetical protein
LVVTLQNAARAQQLTAAKTVDAAMVCVAHIAACAGITLNVVATALQAQHLRQIRIQMILGPLPIWVVLVILVSNFSLEKKAEVHTESRISRWT